MKEIKFDSQIPDEVVRSEIINEIMRNYDFFDYGFLSESTCGRKINYIQIGDKENMILLSAGFHGMEWLTTLLLLKFTDEIGKCVKTGQTIAGINVCEFLQNKGIMIVPCVNPDGTEISINGYKSACKYSDLVKRASGGNTDNWQANARGVDINHNFNAGWHELHKLEQKSNINGPGPTRYGGEYPESEIETKAITNLCRNTYFRHAIAFHSQGEEIYWQYGDDMSEKSELIAKVLSVSSGYKMAQPEGLAVGGGFKDWFIKEIKRPGLTIEIGKGKNPLPIADFNDIYNRLEEMLVLSVII